MLPCAVLMAIDQPKHPKLHMAVNAHLLTNKKSYFGATPFKSIAPTEYRTELVDLNGDDTMEALVLMLGRDWGGTSGQTMFIFKGNPKGFNFVSKMTCVRGPMPGSVCITETKSNGWRDIAVRISGNPSKPEFAAMKFDGHKYPLNPTVVPVMTDWPGNNFVLISGDATAKALSPGACYFTGILGKTMKVQMALNVKEGLVKGSYYYEKYGIPIELKGTLSGTRLRLSEYDKNKKLTATLRMQMDSRIGIASGQWTRADGQKTFPLRLQHVATSMQRHTDTVNKSNLDTEFPVLVAGIPATTLGPFNSIISRIFLERFRKATKEFAKAEDDERPYTYNDSANISYFSSDLISILGSNYNYTGGAHGNFHNFGMNLWNKKGLIQELKLSDLFSTDTRWKGAVGRYLKQALVKHGAQWVLDGSVKESNLANHQNFTISPAGVEFHFAPYAVGPYAQGDFHVIVPYTILQPYLHKAGPLIRWAK